MDNKNQFVEKILPNNNPISVENYQSVGAYIALFSWFGVTDLHKGNVIYKTIDGKVMCTPIDIECIFSDIYLPSQTLLIPRCSDSQNLSGLFKIIDHLKSESPIEDIFSLIEGYVEYLLFLNTIKQKIADLINSIEGIHQIPIRVVANNTSSYNAFTDDSEHKALNKKLFDKTEITQLQRHDIPYYFHYINDNKIYYYKSPGEKSKVSLSSKIHTRIHKLSRRQGVMPSVDAYNNLLEAGTLQISKLLIPKDFVGDIHGPKLSLSTTKTSLGVKYHGRFNVECEK